MQSIDKKFTPEGIERFWSIELRIVNFLENIQECGDIHFDNADLALHFHYDICITIRYHGSYTCSSCNLKKKDSFCDNNSLPLRYSLSECVVYSSQFRSSRASLSSPQ